MRKNIRHWHALSVLDLTFSPGGKCQGHMLPILGHLLCHICVYNFVYHGSIFIITVVKVYLVKTNYTITTEIMFYRHDYLFIFINIYLYILILRNLC